MILVFLENEVPFFRPTDAQAARFDRMLPADADRPVRLCRTEAQFTSLLPQATAVFVWSFRQEWFALAPKLRHVCTPAAGRDYFRVTPPPRVEMHYGSFHGAIMGETALGAMLACSHGLLQCAQAMHAPDAAEWPRGDFASARRLAGSTVLILGCGKIGVTLARMLEPFGTRTIGITRSGRAAAGVEAAPASRVDEFLPLADHVVCFLPSGAETDGFVSARRIALLRPSAFFYNFGRGNSVDESALAAALNEGRLAGAVLDVFASEPPAADSPLRSARRCFLYPHASAFAPDYLDLYFEKAAAAMAACGK